MINIRHIWPTITGSAFILLSACSSPQTVGTPGRISSAHSQAVHTSSGSLQSIADSLAGNGNHEAAIPLYRQLMAMPSYGPQTSAVEENLAKSLIASGVYSEAETILLTRIKRGYGSAQSHHLLGKLYLSNGQFAKALFNFTAALNIAPFDTQIQSGRAITLAALGRTSDAIAAFGVNADPVSISNKALVFAATGDAETAITILEPQVTSGQLGPRGRQNLAFAYLMNNDEAKAYQIARLDLDAATLDDTFLFYRSLKSLEHAERMQALVTGSINPEWDTKEAANLKLTDSNDKIAATKRLLAKPELPKEKISIQTPPEPEPAEEYELTEVPPLIEPEGWALQIGAYRTINRLMRGWTILYRANSDILEGIPPRRSEVDFGDDVKEGTPKGFYFRLNAGPLKSLARARELCTELKARGTSCWIRPPEKSEGNLPSETEEEG